MKQTIEEIVENILKTNQQFEESSPEEKRVMIAADTIKWIESERLVAARQRLLLFGRTDRNESIIDSVYVKPDQSVQKLLFETQIPCEVCAKGALFMSCVGRTNKMNGSNLSSGYANSVNSKEIIKLAETFEENQMALIELAYEGDQYQYKDLKGGDIKFSQEQWDDARNNFFHKYKNLNERLIAICQNIIDNKGTFVP